MDRRYPPSIALYSTYRAPLPVVSQVSSSGRAVMSSPLFVGTVLSLSVVFINANLTNVQLAHTPPSWKSPSNVSGLNILAYC